jgi:DNA-binding transcriptional MerR regulator
VTKHFRVGEFADLGGVSRKTLRFYDEIGLLRPASVDPRTQYRRYVPEQLKDLASILALKSLGVSLAEIRQITGKGGSVVERKVILKQLKQRVERSIHIAGQSLNWINAALDELGLPQSRIPVVVKRRPGVPIASLRVKLNSYEETARFEQELLSLVPPECRGTLRGVLWHRCADSGLLEAEPFIALAKRLPGKIGCDLKHLPEALLACAYSGDDEESAEQAYAAIRSWMKVRGYRSAGPKRELYLGPMLEIQFPLPGNSWPS